MKRKLVLFTLILFVFFSVKNILFAQEDLRPPFELESLSISMLDSEERTALVEFSSTIKVSGEVGISLYIPNEFALNDGKKKLPQKSMSEGGTVNQQWVVKIPENGYYLLEINLNIFNEKMAGEGPQYANYHSFPLYVEISNGKIVSFDYKQDPKFTVPTTEDEKTLKGNKPTATPMPFDTSSLGYTEKTISQKAAGTSSYTISVIVSGQINYESELSIIKGVPNVGVYLDWDYDNNINTGYTPYYGNNTLHVDYDVTDVNGYYYFSFSFTSDYPANYYSDKIRIYANNANSAAFDGDLGNGAKFGVNYYLSISSATTLVYSSTASLRVDSYQGGALRHLYRARLFSINSLSFTPNTIRYYIRTSSSTSFFCGSGNCGGMNMTVPRIVFNRVPDAGVAYHEYGHFVEYNKVGFLPDDSFSGSHWFRRQTGPATAWKEGWAEFYCAATHMYWYNIELPSAIEYNDQDYESPYPRVYQFMDYSPSTLFTDRNNEEVEGAIACFFYSLWDGVGRRAPNYYGDNDDISFSGAFILNNLGNRYNILGQLLGGSQIESYKIALLNALDSQNDASVNSLYNSIILKSGVPRSATPTSLSVSGTGSSRSLSWNDNTCPSSISYTEETGNTYSYDLVENQESGFRIYRKANVTSWDGTLDGYTLVGTVAQNTTTWTDNSSISGNYSYVVVAYNGSGNSVPKAEHHANYIPPLSATISGPSSLSSGQSGTWTVTASGGASPYSYSWSYYVFCDDLPIEESITGTGGTVTPNAVPCGYWFSISITTNTLTRSSDGKTFQLKCIVTDANNSTYTVTKTVSGSNSALILENGADSIIANYDESITVEALENYPNPFNPTTNIRVEIPASSHIVLKVYDILGREVRVLANKVFAAGRYEFNFDAGKLPSGIYICRLDTETKSISRKMLLIK